MRSILLSAALLLCAVPTLAQPAQVYPDAEWAAWDTPAAAGYDADALDDLRAYVATLNTDGLLVIAGGRVLFAYGDVDTVSYVASVRKSVLAMLYGNHVADGTLDLDATLADLGMDDVLGLSDAERQATVRHLIAARSGIYHPASNGGDNSADAPPRGSQAPGTYYLYNNWDFNAAGTAFERATGRDLYDALDTDLARPLGFQDWDRDRHQRTGNADRSRHLAYHMHFSTRDMARLGLLMLRDGRWHDEQVIPADWARQIVSVVTPVEEMNPEDFRQRAFGYGYMWWVWDGPNVPEAFRGAFSANGHFGQYITALPALDLVVAHKTLPTRYETSEEYADVRVSWDQFQGILDRLVAARQ